MIRNGYATALVVVVLLGLVAGCGPAPTPEIVTEVETQVVVETQIVKETQVVVETAVVKETQVVKETEVVVVTATPEPTVVPEPKYGGTLRLGTTNSPLDLDPHKVVSQDGSPILMNAYSTLTKIAPDGSIVGDLAKSWEVSDDGLVYTFYLNEGVKFHNLEPVNGRELTADDVVYSIQRIKTDDPAFTMAGDYARIAGAEAVDDYTVAITLAWPGVGFLTQISGERPIYVVPKEAVEEFGDLSANVIGSGPFMLDWYERDLGYGMIKNPDYFVEGVPYLDGVEVRVIPEMSGMDAAFLAKDLDAHYPSIPTYQLWKDLYPDMYFVRTLDGWGPPILLLNGNKPPFDDPRVRKAISLAIDRRKVLDAYGFGEGVLAGPIPDYAQPWALPQEELLQVPGWREDHEADIAEAKRLLAEAGYPDGERLEQYMLKSSSGHEASWQLANVLQARLKEDLGIEFELNSQDFGAMIGDVLNNNYELVAMTIDVPADPDDILVRFFHPDVLGGVVGITRETEPELVALIEQQANESDRAKRQELVWEVQRRLIEGAWQVSLVDRAQYEAYWDHVKGVETYPIRARYGWAHMWLDR
jgi:peptide/nickel transport system substrate-binding protein